MLIILQLFIAPRIREKEAEPQFFMTLLLNVRRRFLQGSIEIFHHRSTGL